MLLLTTAYCRLHQTLRRAGMRPPKGQMAEEGASSIFAAAQLIRANRLGKPLVILGAGTERWQERLFRSLRESDIPYAVWDRLSAVPTADDAENIRLYWIGEGCACFLVLGDGAALDIAKTAAARAARPGRSVMSMVGRGRLHRKKTPPVIVIPTATGAGAEALGSADFSDGRGNTFTVSDRSLIPAYAVLDPELLEDMPREVLARNAAEGLSLAVEAYCSGYADDAARHAAAEAVRGFFEAVEPCWNSGGSTRQRSILLNASRRAGEAASRAGFGYVRAMSRAVSRVCGISPGDACAVFLPICLEKYGKHAEPMLAALAEEAEVCAEGTRTEKAAALIERIRRMTFCIGLPDTLEEISDSNMDEIADLTVLEANPRYAAPAVWEAAQCASVLRVACGMPEKNAGKG